MIDVWIVCVCDGMWIVCVESVCVVSRRNPQGSTTTSLAYFWDLNDVWKSVKNDHFYVFTVGLKIRSGGPLGMYVCMYACLYVCMYV